MKYAVEMYSGVKIYILSFIKYWLRHFKVVGGRGLNIKAHSMMIS
jgi:hypothetical protein